MGATTKVRGWRTSPGAACPELEVNLCCGRALIDPAATERIRLFIRNGLNWPDVVANADRHRLSPIVYEIITRTAQDLISPAQLNVIRGAAAPSTFVGMALLWELLHLHQLFEAAQILVIPYKGPVLAWVAYGSFIRREYSDLDFAVEQKYIPDVVAVLQSNGYLPQFDPREAHAGHDRSAPGQYSFLSHPQKFWPNFIPSGPSDIFRFPSTFRI